MPHFVYVIGSLRCGGSERQLVHLACGLRRESIDVTVVVWNFNENDANVAPLRDCGATVLAAGAGSRFAKLRALRRLLRRSSIDVIHSFSFYLNAIVAVAAAGTGAMAVGSIRSAVWQAARDSGRLLGSLSARWPRRQVSNNAAAVQEVQRRRWLRPATVAVVANFIDFETFPDVGPPRSTTPRIVAIGSLLAYKRWDRLVRIGARLRDSGIHCDIVIAGDGPMRASLAAEIDRLALPDRVTLLGYIADVRQILADAWFLVHVSDTEGSPNAVVEALACGRTVVATAVGDVPALVSDGETGYVVPNGDDDALYARVAELAGDRERCTEMGRNARRMMWDRFARYSVAAATLDAYRTLRGNG